jgi:hypothetical protein
MLLRRLREADGGTVTYAELRDVGIELPASVVSELELAGIPIEHGYESGEGGLRRPGVRLNPALDPERVTEEATEAEDATTEAAPVRAERKPARASKNRIAPSVSQVPLPSLRGLNLSSLKGLSLPSVKGRPLPSIKGLSLPSVKGRPLPSIKGVSVPAVRRLSLPSGSRLTDLRPPRRALAPIALIGAMVVVIAVVVLALQAGRANPRHAIRHHASNPQPRSTSVVARAPQSSPPPPTPPTPVSPALATEFEAQGHNLLESGQYSGAVPVLRRALAATGKQLSDCIEPVSETCLTYAYALYDLGRALELNGEPSAALPVMEQRLQIDNQRDVVAAELAHLRTIAQP